MIFLVVGFKSFVGFGIYGVIKFVVCNLMEVICMESV